MKIKPYDGRHDGQIETIVELVKHKMAEHSYKGEWSNITVANLFEYLQSEVAELDLAIADGNVIEALREIGDVGACLVMIAESLMRQRTLTPAVIKDVQERVEKEKS